MRPEPSVNFLNISCKIKFYQQLAEFQDYEQKLGEERTFAKIIFYSFQIDDNYCKSWAVCHLDQIFTRLNFPFSISSSHEACKKRCMEPAPESPPPAKCPIKETIKSEISPVSKSIERLQSQWLVIYLDVPTKLITICKINCIPRTSRWCMMHCGGGEFPWVSLTLQ